MKSLLRLTLAGCLLSAGTAAPARDFWVYIGTFTDGVSKGIYVSRLDADTGRLTPTRLAAATPDPSYLALAANQKFLYAVNEFPGQQTGRVSAFAIHPDSGQLELLDQKPSGGRGPCHVSVDHSGHALLVANYASGSIESLPILDDGRLGDGGSQIQFQGRGVNPDRQTAPHAHFLAVDPSNRFALGCDLGTDHVLVYHLDPAAATLAADNPLFATVLPGCGPRHLVFARDGKFVYVVNEMACTVTVCDWDGQTGRLNPWKYVSALPPNETVQPDFTAAEIVLHPSGRFLYVSVRGHDSVSVFAIDEKSGGLALIQNVSSGGKAPRGLGIDPTGRWLFTGNQKTGNVAEFAIDPATGKLTPMPAALAVGAPVDFKFVAAE